ncbi:hypothetical protein DSO57_1001363 [Entomophthora muscae]|uniref:Uncharacterized protein n=1 Tax=Entomophthora muscae TaxID=34485 RepID=A0ACC2SY35_9FUNG|nr:hypothetical protein DSO57_1001363 [Entomophthora muscae]
MILSKAKGGSNFTAPILWCSLPFGLVVPLPTSNSTPISNWYPDRKLELDKNRKNVVPVLLIISKVGPTVGSLFGPGSGP